MTAPTRSGGVRLYWIDWPALMTSSARPAFSPKNSRVPSVNTALGARALTRIPSRPELAREPPCQADHPNARVAAPIMSEAEPEPALLTSSVTPTAFPLSASMRSNVAAQSFTSAATTNAPAARLRANSCPIPRAALVTTTLSRTVNCGVLSLLTRKPQPRDREPRCRAWLLLLFLQQIISQGGQATAFSSLSLVS